MTANVRDSSDPASETTAIGSAEEFRPRVVLVTGGCGFIGSNFIRYLLQVHSDLSVINLDKLTYAGNLENLADVADHPRYRFIQGDICDRELVKGVLANELPFGKIDAVLNFAAESHVDRSIIDSSPFVRTNIMGTQVLLDICRESGIPRYLQVSTDEVYGSLEATGFFTEETPLAPNSPYAASKTSADLLVRSYIHTFEFPAIITRCSNNYGPYQFPEKIIPLFIANAMDDQALPVYGAGQNVRDWIHVLDHCRGIDAALRRGRVGEVYNFGGGNELTNLDLTYLLLDLMGKPRTLIKYVKDRPGHDLRYAIDSSKAKSALGWQPAVDFRHGLKTTMEWYQQHQDWVSGIRTGEYLKYYDRQYGNR
ncbi:MAG: dTDP-glucose 4,6-dehydratase [Planctomycetaceae bacterium]